MKIGFMLPMFGAMATHQNMFDMAQLAEERGFESVWAPDHVIMPTRINTTYPYSHSGDYIADPMGDHLEPFTSLSYIAGCTKRVRLGFTVIVAPYRNPIVTGKMMASMDVLSNGRLMVGAGAGWLKEEFDALEVPFNRRWARTEEHIRIWKELWCAEEPEFNGEYHRFSHVQCRPQPLQRPHPPITIGGNGKACFKRVVELADGWQVVTTGPEDSFSSGGNLKDSLAILKGMADDAGRDFASIETTAVVIVGTPQSVLKDIPEYERLGISRLILDFPSFVSDPREMESMLTTVADGADMQPA
ncbi:MAG: LLM class F420-dependent oxidoreductase [Pseudomonadota bacterium]